MAALALENISHRFDAAWAVQGLSLAVDAGEIVCVLGPSGSGKTTVLRLAAGLEPVQAGCVRLGDRVVGEGGAAREVPPEDRALGFMFQDYALFPHLTVQENVGFGIPRREPDRDGWVTRALREMHLEGLAGRYPHTLSGGQQQRIALLRALAPRPRVMLLDEPFSGLDEHLRQQIRLETLRLLQRSHAATLMVTHDPEEAMFLADRIVVLNHGRVVQDAPPVDIYDRPVDPFVARLFGPVNEFTGEVRSERVETPLGSIAAQGFEDGSPVLVLVRASDVSILGDGEDSHGSVPARVRSARPLGPTSDVRLIIGDGEHAAEISMRIAGLSPPESAADLQVKVRDGRTFVYPH